VAVEYVLPLLRIRDVLDPNHGPENVDPKVLHNLSQSFKEYTGAIGHHRLIRK
jgi:hypothetical protein